MALADVAKLIVALTLDDKLTGPLGRVEAGLSRMGTGVGQVAGGLGKLATVAGVAAAGGLALTVKAAVDFEDAFAGIKKTVDETDLEAAGLSFEDLSDSIRKMAREIPVSAVELSRIGEAAGALGVRAEDIDDFVRVVAELSVATNLSADQAATALGQLGTILNLTGDDFRDFSDSLVALGNAGASTEDQIIDIAARFAAAGRSAGLSNEEILALASATASMGIDAEAAGSSLSRVFSRVATQIGTSSTKADAFAEALGLSASEFRDAWEDDALGTFNEFLEKLNTLDQFEASALLEKVGITGQRDVNAVRLMAQNIDDVNKALEVSEGATDSLGIEARKKFETTASQLKILRQNFEDIGITIGNEVLPIITDLTKEFVDFVNQPGVQKDIKDFATDLAGGIKSLVGELKGTDFSGIIGGMKIAAEVAKGAFDAFRALPEPIQQLAIAALVANKVSGGAVGQIAKGLGNILLGGLKTITAANVTVIGKNVIGPGLPGGPSGGPGFNPLGWIPIIAGALLVFEASRKQEEAAERTREQGLPSLPGEWLLGPWFKPTEENTDALKENTDALKGQTGQPLGPPLPLNDPRTLAGSFGGGLFGPLITSAISEIESRVTMPDTAMLHSDMLDLGGTMADTAMAVDDVETEVAKLPPILDRITHTAMDQKEAQRLTAANTADSARWTGLANANLTTIAAKKFGADVKVNVTAVTNVSVNPLQRTLTSARIAGSGTIGGFTESAFG